MPSVKYDVKLHLHFSEDVCWGIYYHDFKFVNGVILAYNQMMTTNAVYKERRIELDAPEFVVFYNGDRNQKEYWEMHLSDAFPEGVKVNIDLRVRVYNINYGKNSKLLQQTNTYVKMEVN